MKRTLLLLFAALLAASVLGDVAGAYEKIPRRRAEWPCWNHFYYDAAWGMPVAIVIPPTAESQTHWGWGIGNTRITTNYVQFDRNYPGPGYYDRRLFQPTPPWPSDTDQFGFYYIRGPW